MSSPKTIQIPVELFAVLVKYHILEESTLENEVYIKKELNKKLLAVKRRTSFTQYKEATNNVEKREALKGYLQALGIPETMMY